jgi:hypothetical protein
MATFDTVRDILLPLPGVEEGTSYGTPALKVRKQLLVRLRDEGDVLVVLVDLADRDMLLAEAPDVFFTTPHYEGYPAVLVRLPAIGDEELRRLLLGAYRYRAPARLVAELDASG